MIHAWKRASTRELPRARESGGGKGWREGEREREREIGHEVCAVLEQTWVAWGEEALALLIENLKQRL